MAHRGDYSGDPGRAPRWDWGRGGGESRRHRTGRSNEKAAPSHLLHLPEFRAVPWLAAPARSADWSSGNGSPNAGTAPVDAGGEMCSDWPAGDAGPPTHGDDKQPSGYLRRRGLAHPAFAPELERNMYRFRSQLFTGISAAAAAASHPRRSSPLLLARDSPLSRPPHRRTSRQCSSIG